MTCNQCVDASIEWQFWVYEYISELLKANLKNQAKQDCPKGNPNPETWTNPVMTVAHVWVFVTFRRELPCHLQITTN